MPSTPSTQAISTVQTVKVAQTLLNRSQLKILREFMCPEGQTIKLAAEKLGLDMNYVYRRVQRFEQLGLLHVLKQQGRRGRDMKVYQALAEQFFIPTSIYPLEDYFYDLFQPFAESFQSNYHRIFEHCEKPVGGILAGLLPSGHVYAIADKNMQVFDDYGDSSPAAVFHGTVLHLDRQAAHELETELFNLILKYSGRQGGMPHALTVLYHPQYTPLQER